MKHKFTLLKRILPFLTFVFISFSGISQTVLSVGDISILGFNSNAPDNFTFVSWVPLSNDTYIKFTDNAFLSSGSANATNNGRGGENFIIWRNNTGSTIAAGTVIQIESLTTNIGVATAGSAGGLNGLSNNGDQIFAYQGASTSGANPDWSSNANPTTFNGTILYGLNFQGSGGVTSWITSGTPNTNISYLPSELNITNGNIALASSASRGEYTGSRSNQLVLSNYKALVNNPANWTTNSGAGILTLNTTNFTTAPVPSPTVDLSISINLGTEAAQTVITATATASTPVTGNQTVTLGVSGAGITASDYVLSSTTITILNGATTGTATFTIRNDAETEGTETATLTISNPSANITLGSTTTQNAAITDNVCQPLLRKSTATSVNGAEISAYDSASKRIFTVAGLVIEYYTLSNTGLLSAPTAIAFGFTAGANSILPNSVAIKNGIVAIGYAIVDPVSLAQQQGIVAFYNASTAAYINSVTVGYLPDMIIFNADGTKVLTANEGEPNSYGQGNSVDPEGSVSIIDISGGVASATVLTAGFTSFNSQMATLKAAGVRIYGPGATVAQDLEPEYIALSEDGNTAYITLQENNAIAVLDISATTITNILPLGLKDHSLAGNGLDASDQDGAGGTKIINIQNWPIKGMYMPDAIAQFSVGGTNYYITANEGDSRAYTGGVGNFSEEARVSTLNLDPAAFPTAATLKLNANLGRLQLTNATGDTDGDGDFDELHALGARSFSIWNSSFTQVFDSKDQLEQITAAQNPLGFNSDGVGTAASFDSRSDNKGPEPEGVAIGMVNGVQYAFIGSERTGDIFVYDITNPTVPVFKQYIDNPTDLQVEGVLFISANQSPTGKALVVVSAEISKTVTVYEFSLITNSLASTYTSITATQQNTTSFGDCIGLVAKVAQSGGSVISGSVTSNVWIEATVPTYNTVPFVQRHYEITPASSATTSTGTVTLYFTQTEFDNFNNDPSSALDLPTGTADAIGKTNLRIIKYPGVSNDGTGLPSSYTTTPEGINPDDNNIVWNATENRWEVSFEVTGFSGFFIQTNTSVLPLTLLNFNANTQGNNVLIDWKTNNEVNNKNYEVLYSVDGINFKVAGERKPLNTNGEKNYSLTHTDASFLSNKLFYRLKITSTSGVVSYSDIVLVRFGTKNNGITDVYPNPTNGILNIVGDATTVKPITIRIVNLDGKIISSQKITTSGTVKLNISSYASGLYLIDATLSDGSKQRFKVLKQ